MINLLPNEEKQKNIEEKKRRVLIVFWFYAFFFLCVFSIVLFFINNYVKTEIEIAQILLSSEEKGFEGQGIKGIQSQISEANRILAKVNSFYSKKPYFGDVISKLSEAIPSGIYLNNISMVAEKEGGFKFSLAGLALAREALFQFKSNLEKDSYFMNIDFPTSNWVKPENINFFAGFEIK